MPDPVIYLGPSLELDVARAHLEAIYLPPIKRGDLERLPPDTEMVGIVDGEFYQALSVSPKEILPLLDRGITVLGAASMGALRAAETHMYGMIGVGAIFEMYRDGIIDADDEVAVSYSPSDGRVLSEALVNIRIALADAASQGIISAHEADRIIRAMKDIYFPFRSWQLVVSLCPALAPLVTATRYDQKRDDTLLLLQTVDGMIKGSAANGGRSGTRL